jgi:putative Mn2+ efflux pump MntP
VFWRRREPIGAVILIALGLLFLLHQVDWFSGRIFEFSWPILLIGLGVWLIVRRLNETKGNSQENSKEGQP